MSARRAPAQPAPARRAWAVRQLAAELDRLAQDAATDVAKAMLDYRIALRGSGAPPEDALIAQPPSSKRHA